MKLLWKILGLIYQRRQPQEPASDKQSNDCNNSSDEVLQDSSQVAARTDLEALESRIALIYGGPPFSETVFVKEIGRHSIGWGCVGSNDKIWVAFFDEAPFDAIVHVTQPVYSRTLLKRLFNLARYLVFLEAHEAAGFGSSQEDQIAKESLDFGDTQIQQLKDKGIDAKWDLIIDLSEAFQILRGDTGIEDHDERFNIYFAKIRQHAEEIRTKMGLLDRIGNQVSPVEPQVSKRAAFLRKLPLHGDPLAKEMDPTSCGPWAQALADYVFGRPPRS